MSDDSPVAAHEETSKESWMVTQDIQANIFSQFKYKWMYFPYKMP